jgi:hypothetical protein
MEFVQVNAVAKLLVFIERTNTIIHEKRLPASRVLKLLITHNVFKACAPHVDQPARRPDNPSIRALTQN